MFTLRLFTAERLRQAYVATALAIFAGLIALLKPIDIAVWALQSKTVDRSASGEIVLVDFGTTKPIENSKLNESLARNIADLRARGAGRIFINVPLKQSDDRAADRRLRSVLQGNQQHVFLGNPGNMKNTQLYSAMLSDPYFTDGIKTFDNSYDRDFLEFIWSFPRTGSDGRTTLAFALAGGASRFDRVALDKSIDSRTIPRVSYFDLDASLNEIGVENKTFVVGDSPGEGDVRLAKNGYQAATVAHILVAETINRGSGRILPFWAMPILTAAMLLAGLLRFESLRSRRGFYAACVGLHVGLVGLAGLLAVQASFSYAFMLLAIYGAFRAVSNYRNTHIYVDPITLSPNFSALTRDLDAKVAQRGIGIVVVKVLRLDALFSQLTLRQKRHYLQQISKRLTLADQSAKIYFDNGKYFALVMSDMGSHVNEEHLSGLRAIVSQAVTVGDSSLDVAITVGADFTGEGSIEHRLSSAISAADQARETFRPVFVVGGPEAGNEEWDHSLSARLSEALAQDRIKMKLQPQIDLQTGRVVGAEALARWQDEDGREIPPASFISQCEMMGRLDDLTKRILERGMAAAITLREAGQDLSVSVNVSAVQLVDERIADIVEAAIWRTGIDPSQLKLEITETARIEDFEIAKKVMDRLLGQGISFSLDDFGVGSANLEVFLKLPFQEVKIDRLFIKDLTASRTARSIVEGVLNTSSALGISSVAEGIEDGETQRLLTEMGCTYGQGFYIAKPQWVSQLVGTLAIPDSQMFRRIQG